MRQGIRIALVALGLNCICFFRGCENHDTHMTFGFPAPIVVVRYNDTIVQTPAGPVDVPVPTKVLSWSAWTPAANALLLLILGVLTWQRGGITPTPWRCFWLAATILNSHLLPVVGFWIWFYAAWLPTGWLSEAVETVLMSRLSKPQFAASDDTGLSVDIASRLYFLMLFGAFWGSASLGGWVYRKFKPTRGAAEAEENGLTVEALRSDAPSPLAPG
jgi:hypothetical protein